MAEFLIPRTIPKFAGTPVTALDLDDLRYLPRHTRRDRLLAAAIERELARRAPRCGFRRRKSFIPN
jgi:hypothetical protein